MSGFASLSKAITNGFDIAGRRFDALGQALRVFAESLGGYVVWFPAQHLVTVHQLPPSAAELAREADALAQIKKRSEDAGNAREDAARKLR